MANNNSHCLLQKLTYLFISLDRAVVEFMDHIMSDSVVGSSPTPGKYIWENILLESSSKFFHLNRALYAPSRALYADLGI